MLTRTSDFNNVDNSHNHWIYAALSKLDFNILSWNAWTPTLHHKKDWINWANSPTPIDEFMIPQDETLLNGPSISFLPIGLRKKLSPISKVLLHLSHCTMKEYGEEHGEKKLPIVFSSCYGESKSTVELLESLGKMEPGSPMAFSRSVHNFSVGLNSIASKNTVTNTAIAAFENSFRAGLLESLMQLHAGEHENVLLVYAEDSNSEVFEQYYKIPVPYGISLILSRNSTNLTKIETKDLFMDSPSSKINVKAESFRFLKNIIHA